MTEQEFRTGASDSAPSLPPHMQRVVEERGELEHKLRALVAFIGTPKFDALADDEKSDLREQAEHMARYRDVLKRRYERAVGQPDSDLDPLFTEGKIGQG